MLGEIYCGRQGGEPLAGYEQEWARIEIRDTRIVALLLLEFLALLPALWVVGEISSRLFPAMRPAYVSSFFKWCYLFLFLFTGVAGSVTRVQDAGRTSWGSSSIFALPGPARIADCRDPDASQSPSKLNKPRVDGLGRAKHQRRRR